MLVIKTDDQQFYKIPSLDWHSPTFFTLTACFSLYSTSDVCATVESH